MITKMKIIRKIFSCIGSAFLGILFLIVVMSVDMVISIAGMFLIAGIGLVETILSHIQFFKHNFILEKIDWLISWSSDHMLYTYIILLIVNGIVILLGILFGDLFDGSPSLGNSSVSNSQPSYAGKSFSEYYEDELRKNRERDQLEELRKINSKLS